MAEKKFEDAMQRLEEIVQGLEQGDLPLGDSLKVFEEGMGLAKFCSRELESAEKKVSLLVKESGGNTAKSHLSRMERKMPDEAVPDLKPISPEKRKRWRLLFRVISLNLKA